MLIDVNDLSSEIKLIGGVNQYDTQHITKIVENEFLENPLDLIIDDCSHYYIPTKRCFEALFGYLRPGGKYIIEDWGWTHWSGAPYQTQNPFGETESMTNLIFELVMALASDQTKIAGVNVADKASVIVTRGEGLPYKSPIDLRAMTIMNGGWEAKLIKEKGEIGRWVRKFPRRATRILRNFAASKDTIT
jgi:hypothetical protein